MQYLRQMDIFNPQEFREKTIAVIGCGAIGSVALALLAKLGFRSFTLFDNDRIEPHNIPNQFYFVNQIKKEKTAAAKEIMELFSDDVHTVITKKKFTKFTVLPYNIVIVATDNMEARKIAFENSQKFADIFIDARMGGQVFRLYTIDMHSQEALELYKENLYDDKKSTEDKCTERSIIFNTMGIASFIGKNLTAALTGKQYWKEVIMDYVNMELIKNGEGNV